MRKGDFIDKAIQVFILLFIFSLFMLFIVGAFGFGRFFVYLTSIPMILFASALVGILIYKIWITE